MDNSSPSYYKQKLWKKDPNSDIFVDFPLPFPSIQWDGFCEKQNALSKHRFLDKEIDPVKNDRVSTEFRVAGNKKFKENKWRAAMEYYNQSLRFAENGSENASLAYANRSACFLHMKKYVQCLKDIEMAKDHNYPKRLMRKLEEREIQCMEQLKEADDVQAEIEPKLSFDPDEKFPCLANVLEIQCNDEYGRHIVAKCDIDVGQTVLVEEPFASVLATMDRTLCFTCLKPMKNFIPCPNCIDAMFCDEKCMQTNDIHKIGCGSVYNRSSGIQFNVQTILIACNAFDTVNDMMEFVEKQLAAPKSELPENCSDAQRKYAMFLKLNETKIESDKDLNTKQHMIYKCIMAFPSINARFNTLKKQRFLMHLIGQHGLISGNRIADVYRDSTDQISGLMEFLGNIQSLFNHSCTPNLYKGSFENKQYCTTIKPVKRGEQLFITYKEGSTTESTEERQEFLRKTFDFTCKCSKCVPSFRDIDCFTIQKDPIYQYIARVEERIEGKIHLISNEERLILKEKCFEFMRKYGHLPSSDEIFLVMVNLMDCLREDYTHQKEIIN